MTRRLYFPDGSVETFRDEHECDLNFQMLAFAGREVSMTTEDGRPLALARRGRIEERDLVLAGTPVVITTATDRFMSNLVEERRARALSLATYVPAAIAGDEEPSLERRPPLAYPLVLAALIAVVIIGAIVQTVANVAAGS